MIQVIFNADDFGFTQDVNEGIVEAHRQGVLTATTLMADGAAFDHAVTLARANPSLDVGVHLVMVQLPGMPPALQDLARALLLGELDVYGEAVKQVRRIVDAGIQPSHIDTHKHTQLFPPVLSVVARVAREFGIPWVRRPFGRMILRRRFDRALAGLRTTDHFVGLRLTGKLDTASMTAALRELPDGLTEFMCHPGRCGAELQNAATRLKESRAIELAALTSADVRRVIEERGIHVTSFNAITRS